MCFLRSQKLRTTRARNSTPSILKLTDGHLGVQPPFDVRPLSFSYQYGSLTYRINLREGENNSVIEIIRDSQPYEIITPNNKGKKRVRFQDSSSPRDFQQNRNASTSRGKRKSQLEIEDAVIQTARANQREVNKKAHRVSGGYHEWLRSRDHQPTQDQSPIENRTGPKLATNYSLPLGNSNARSRPSSASRPSRLSPRPVPVRFYPDESPGEDWPLVSPRPLPVRYYPEDESSEAVQETGLQLPPHNLVSLESQPQASVKSRRFLGLEPSQLNQKQVAKSVSFDPMEPGLPFTRMRNRKRLTKRQRK